MQPIKTILLSFVFWLSVGNLSSLAAMGPEESSCSDEPKLACSTNDPSVLEYRKSRITKLYQDLVFPGPLEILKDFDQAGEIFEKSSIKGRVTPVGKFSDFEGVVEYFYALAANPETKVYKVDVKTLLAEGDKVFVTTYLSFCPRQQDDCTNQSESETFRNTLMETGIFTFNKSNKVIEFDLQIPNLGAAYDITSKLEKAKRIAGVCAFLTIGHLNPITLEQVAGGTCTSYFDSRDDFGKGFLYVPGAPFINCVKFMSSLPYGSFDRANSNTFTCRSVHMLLTPLRPDIHCKHVSYDGGGKCVDMPYESYFTEFDEDGQSSH